MAGDFIFEGKYFPDHFWPEDSEYWPESPLENIPGGLEPGLKNYFWINIEDSSGNLYGDGPIIDAIKFSVKRCLDKAGQISFSLPASSSRANLIAPKRIAKCYTIINDAVVEFGAGIIDKINYSVDTYGVVNMEVQGDDLLRELTYRTVGFLQVDESTQGKIGLQAIGTYFPSGWSYDTVNGYNSTIETIYASFAGETVLNCLNKVSEKLGEHFRLGIDKKIIWLRKDQPSSGIRAIRNLVNPIEAETSTSICLISDLQETRDTYELYTRIYPFGSGNGEDRLDLFWSTLVLPSGWTIDRTFNYIQNDAAVSAYGLIERYISFKDIGPISNSDEDLKNASNFLLYAAYEELRKSIDINKSYDLSVEKLDTIVYPGQTIKIEYQDWIENIQILNINADLFILETDTEVDNFGIRTTNMSVSTIDRRPKTDYDLITGQLAESRVFEAHPQFSVGYFSESFGQYNLDSDSSQTNFASMTFKFGNEIVKLNNAKLRFRTDVFESTTKGAGGGGQTVSTTEGGGAITKTSEGGGGIEKSSGGGGGITKSSGDEGLHGHPLVIDNDPDANTGTPVYVKTGILAADYGSDVTLNTGASFSPHSHSLQLDPHIHSITLDPHVHPFELEDHVHPLTLEDHVHPVLYGVQRNIGEYPGPLTLTIDGIDYLLNSGQTGSATESTGEIEVDVTDLVNNNLRQVHTIVFTCAGGKGRITAALRCFVTVQAIILT